jgi:hypothetical protein
VALGLDLRAGAHLMREVDGQNGCRQRLLKLGDWRSRRGTAMCAPDPADLSSEPVAPGQAGTP